MDILAALNKNPFALAPMAAITDCAFRTVMRSLGCGPVITELVSAHGLEYQSPKTIKLMDFEPSQRPLGIQLFGETPEILARGARIAEATGCDFIDLNFGCPVPKVVKKGGGSAILRDLPRVRDTFRAVKSAVACPVTVKIRTGWDESNRNASDVAQVAFDEGLSWVAIHGRTRAAGYSGAADWQFIAEVKAKSRIPIIGNGDIASGAQAVARMRESGVDGVMIGRGCLKDPWIFREAMRVWNPARAAELEAAASSAPGDHDFEGLFVQLRDLYDGTGSDAGQKADQKIVGIQLRKFASWYSAGYPGASTFRKAIFQTESVDAAMELSLRFFGDLRAVAQADTSQEAFLMGGHG